MNNVDCLVTTFRNVAVPATVLRTSLMAPHGWEFPINGEASFMGSPTEIVTRGRSPSHCSRALQGLEAALVGDLLAIKKTPNPIMYDVANNQTKMLKTNGGELYAADPCWANYATSSQFSA